MERFNRLRNKVYTYCYCSLQSVFGTLNCQKMGLINRHSVVAKMVKASNVTNMKARTPVRISALPSIFVYWMHFPNNVLATTTDFYSHCKDGICKIIMTETSRSEPSGQLTLQMSYLSPLQLNVVL